MPAGTSFQSPYNTLQGMIAGAYPTSSYDRFNANSYQPPLPPPNEAYRNWQGIPQGGQGAGFNWGQLAGMSSFDARSRLLAAGINPGSYTLPDQSQGTGPNSSYWNAGPGRQIASPGFSQPGLNSPWLGNAGGGGGLPSQSSSVGGGVAPGIGAGANRPFNMSPFYLDPGANSGARGGAVPSGDAGGKIVPPRVANPMIPPQITPTQLGGGFGGAAPNVMQQAQQAGMGGMTAGATPAGAGMREWETGQPGQSREEAGFNFLMAGGMPEAQARQQTGWTGPGMTAAAQQSRQFVGAFNTANTASLAAARPAYEAARARENPTATSIPYGGVSHSGGALQPNLGGGIGQAGSGQYAPPQAPKPPGYTGIAGGQGNSINTYGTPSAGARLGSSGYRY